MNFVSVRIITDDVDRLVEFYEIVMGVLAERPAPVFAELVTPTCTLAIGHAIEQHGILDEPYHTFEAYR